MGWRERLKGSGRGVMIRISKQWTHHGRIQPGVEDDRGSRGGGDG